jgi:hypothetical protein
MNNGRGFAIRENSTKMKLDNLLPVTLFQIQDIFLRPEVNCKIPYQNMLAISETAYFASM